ncbi:glycosyltransferase family 4 protein [Sphingomonas desiccabilis]|uniref:Glycosyltransferase n=1 Tax=Sphingomonas desiccabilis TaxID=429134 RepID=A0A4Q2ISZ0_9SPHN|nr:glycosyltransferase family 4 protein [Sphingomonas desiccabilis]MBB3911814.1 glycosyltransferase involved in cell wall biosynthesis [Sphingomonas desiccabilis]RXZ31468.1 glycosyltransferase [Sphingomonas desiccabilis]
MSGRRDDRPLRILLSIHHRLDRDTGAAGVVMRIGEEYRRLGHAVRIVSHDDLPMGITGPAAGILFPWILARAVKRWHPDVVDASSGDGWLAFARRGSGGPLCVTHSHGLEQLSSASEIAEAAREGRRPGLSKRLWRHGLRLRLVARSFVSADLALVLNDAEAAYLEQRVGVRSAAIRRIQLGTDLAGMAVETPQGSSGDVVQIGAYSWRKGVHVTAHAMASVMAERPDVTMTFVGTGKSREDVLTDYPAHLHPRIRVVPRYANAELPGLLASGSVCLMPSLFEGYGIAKIEAMAAGLAVVTSDDPGSRADIVDGVNGLVVPRGDPPALAAAVRLLLDHPGKARALATAGRATAKARSWSAVARERLALYRTACR